MKSIFTSALFLATAFGTVVPTAEKKIDYNGFKLLRVTLPEGASDVRFKIENLAAHILNPGKSNNFDVVISPDKIDALNALVKDSIVINQDVGAALAQEGELRPHGRTLPIHACSCCGLSLES